MAELECDCWRDCSSLPPSRRLTALAVWGMGRRATAGEDWNCSGGGSGEMVAAAEGTAATGAGERGGGGVLVPSLNVSVITLPRISFITSPRIHGRISEGEGGELFRFIVGGNSSC